MAEVITFLNYTPPARYDLLPWTEVRIYESDAADGAYTLLDTIALNPLDPDPSTPAARSFTTELGTAIDYWYELVFADASGDVSQATAPIQNISGSEAVAVTAYATESELAAILPGINAITRSADLLRVLGMAKLEIDKEIGRDLDANPWNFTNAEGAAAYPLLQHVNLERAADLWHMENVQSGLLLGGDTPLLAPRNSWDRYANMLAPLKETWGLA